MKGIPTTWQIDTPLMQLSSDIYCKKKIKTAYARSSYGRGYNRLHVNYGNWGEKTICRSTPRWPVSSSFLLAALAV